MTDRLADPIARLTAAWRDGTLVEADTAGEPRDIAETRTIQSAVLQAMGWRVGGWKVGRWNAGAPLFCAPIRADLMRPAPDSRRPEETRLRGLELEIGFRIDTALPAADDADFLRKLADAVTPMAVFEMVDSRLRDPLAASPLWRLADFQMNAGLIHGTPLAGSWRPDIFDKPDVKLVANGETIFDQPATLNTGTPFGMLADLVRQCNSPGGNHCGGVQPGQIVTTGAFTGLRFFPPGTTLTGHISGLAPITMTFAG